MIQNCVSWIIHNQSYWVVSCLNILFFCVCDLPFALMWNVHFWNCYVHSRDYAMEPPFNHLDLTSSDKLSLESSLTIAIYHFLWQNKGKDAQSPLAHSAPQSSNLISHLSTTKLSSKPCRAIPHLLTPLEEFFPYDSRNLFSVYSSFSSFAVAMTWPGRPTPSRGWR